MRETKALSLVVRVSWTTGAGARVNDDKLPVEGIYMKANIVKFGLIPVS